MSLCTACRAPPSSRILHPRAFCWGHPSPQPCLVPLPNAIDNWFLPLHNAIMATKLTLDKAGRVVLPKPLRDPLQLAPGAPLHLDSEALRLTLPPSRPTSILNN